TDQLYGGDSEMRLKQEILLGIGGYRALEALGLQPAVYHMNEGHAAFVGLERVRRLCETRGLSFAEARELASAGLIFTTHTPVPAGHDRFSVELIDRYFGEYGASLGLARHDFLALGRESPADRRLWQRVERISAEELWRTHERRREYLIAWARQRVRAQRLRRGAPWAEIEAADDVLDPGALTLGFSRRFATYKRATLIL